MECPNVQRAHHRQNKLQKYLAFFAQRESSLNKRFAGTNEIKKQNDTRNARTTGKTKYKYSWLFVQRENLLNKQFAVTHEIKKNKT